MKSLYTLAVLAVFRLLSWIIIAVRTAWWFAMNLPRHILRSLDVVYYGNVRLRRRLLGQPLWQVHDYTKLGIDPPEGWPSIAVEQREQMMAQGWRFSGPPQWPPLPPHAQVLGASWTCPKCEAQCIDDQCACGVRRIRSEEVG